MSLVVFEKTQSKLIASCIMSLGKINLYPTQWPQECVDDVEFISYLIIHETVHIAIHKIEESYTFQAPTKYLHWPFIHGIADSEHYHYVDPR